MKDEKEVQDELDNLRPTYKDIQNINNLMEETKSDDKMQNSQFMQFLQNLKNKQPVNDQYDESQIWANQFQVSYLCVMCYAYLLCLQQSHILTYIHDKKGWNDANDIDALN